MLFVLASVIVHHAFRAYLERKGPKTWYYLGLSGEWGEKNNTGMGSLHLKQLTINKLCQIYNRNVSNLAQK